MIVTALGEADRCFVIPDWPPLDKVWRRSRRPPQDSKAPRSGAVPVYGSPTPVPLSINVLPAARRRLGSTGRLPSAWRDASQPDVDTLWNCPFDRVTPRFQELNASSAPVRFDSRVPV